MTRYDTSSLPTCEDCPLVNVTMSDLDKLYDMSFSRPEIAAASEAISAKMMSLMTICDYSARVDCPSTPKELPPEPQPMPPVGHPDRIAYGRHCLAYLALRKDNNQP